MPSLAGINATIIVLLVSADISNANLLTGNPATNGVDVLLFHVEQLANMPAFEDRCTGCKAYRSACRTGVDSDRLVNVHVSKWTADCGHLCSAPVIVRIALDFHRWVVRMANRHHVCALRVFQQIDIYSGPRRCYVDRLAGTGSR